MKKVALSLAGVLAAAAFAPEASALPAFARQTGMACTACHFQHFPVLNGFGQAFRASGYTLMGAQNKVEGDHLSLPESLNAAFLLKVRYQKTDAPNAGVNDLGGGQIQLPDEYSLFFGGRIADSETIKVGFMTENAPAGGAAGILNGIKVPIVVNAGAVNISVIPYMTDALGVAYGFEQSSAGVTRGIRWAEHRKDISAAQYTGVGSGTATGVALVAQNDMGYINYSMWSQSFTYGAGTGSPTSSWLRIAATPTVADWALHIGYGVAGGKSSADGVTETDTKGSTLDLQAQGEVAGMETSFYLMSSIADKSSATRVNAFNASAANDVTATSVGADFTVIPHTLSLGVAMRNGKNGAAKSDNSITLAAVYDLFQNVALVANHSMYSGDANTAAGKKSLTTLMLEAAY